ncbi:putative biofilm formation methyltransferase WspC [Cupriavidus yeoncheonensis]|uniref:Biofilm formation methyltransferase WspC n=1 Tax=Cupriavidus yeoncheonensis TaxID=1462994 RepID=A0A916IYY8_9BURK|nr:protein-glutamate O-methyltransferase CheR [Cupriavidus yeoncheonensis]CAG2152422.1 putative biofilm formation methyltransferase WspC [Cupriavidus yeoncheonensis]
MSTATHIEALLKARIGLDARSIGPGALDRALRERQAALQAHDVAAYWNLLHSHPDEFQALIEAVVVPETWFFRHREALLALGRFAAERVFGNPTRQVRVLSLPCASGEEPYSIAMALLDVGIPPARFRIDALDISACALARARAGVYGSNAFRGEALDFRDRYFRPCPGGFALDARVRELVQPRLGNIVDPDLLAGEAPYDFVFCRNLLIYFDADVQRRAVHTLARLTASDGMIFVGPAEASLLSAQGLQSAGVPLAFAFRKSRTDEARNAGPIQSRAVQATAPASMPPPPVNFHARPVPAKREPKHAPPRPRPAAAEPTDALAGISALADRGELEAATAACEALIAGQGPSADACCLLGVLHDAAGRTQSARDAYRRAIYLAPGHQEALYHLAARLEAEGDHAGATRLRQRAQRHTRTG